MRGLLTSLTVCGLVMSLSGVAAAQGSAAQPAPGVDPTPQGAAPGVDPTPQGAAPGVDPTPAEPPTEELAPAAETAPVGAAASGRSEDAIVADAERGSSPVELPGRTYHFLGARGRALIVPKFMQNLFADGGRTVLAYSVGPEYALRKNGFEYVFNLSYASYAMAPTPFKSSTDEEKAWEVVESQLSMIQFTTEFLWSTEFAPEFALNYGFGFGLGFIFGDLLRDQAYRDGSGNYVKCRGPGNPDIDGYCGNDNDHYGGYVEKSWAEGGSRPMVFPLIQLQTGLRYKPVANFATRLDLGFGSSGFLVGLGADYGL